MTQDELLDVIFNFQEALKKRKTPDFGKNQHRVEQVLRLLKVAYVLDLTHKMAVDPKVRDMWENFPESELSRRASRFRREKYRATRASRWFKEYRVR
jgi:hypothetical protein